MFRFFVCQRISAMTGTTDNIGGIFMMASPRDLALGGGALSRRDAVRRDDLAGRWVPPLAWIAIALLVGPYTPAWIWMWLLAFAVFAACKWATWWPHRFESAVTPARHAGFLFAYAGMDAETFFLGPPVPAPR